MAPGASQKFRMIQDQQSDERYQVAAIESFDLRVTPEGRRFQWKILCQEKGTKKTRSLLKEAVSGSFSDFFHEPDVNGDTFAEWDIVDKKTCFFSVQNLEHNPLNFQFTNASQMTPHKVKVHAIGKAGNREKQIGFYYSQKNLGSLFDFVLFHTDSGL